MAIYTDFKDFVENIPQSGRLLCVDWGRIRIGLAISDNNMGFAFPYDTVRGKIIDIINLEKPVGIIIGLPVFSDGTDSETTSLVRRFAQDLLGLTDLPITFVDESLSSAAATELMKSASKSEQNKGLDAFAAAVILEDALAKIKRIRK